MTSKQPDKQKLKNKRSDPLKTMQHPRPWRNIGIGLIVIFGLLAITVGIYRYWTESQEQAKFEAIDERVTKMVKAIEDKTSLNAKIKKDKTCEVQYNGFNHVTECGSRVDFIVGNKIDREKQRADIKQALAGTGISLDFSKEISEGAVFSGSILFNDAPYNGCRGFWQTSDATVSYTIRCTALASKILTGYRIIK